MKFALLAISALTLSVSTASAAGLRFAHEEPSIVEQAASWRYHRGCAWRGDRWIVDIGRGKIVTCRPFRPGPGFVWYSEGNRQGWYDKRRRAWHNNNW